MNFGHPQGKLIAVGMLLLVLLFGVVLPVLVSGMAPAVLVEVGGGDFTLSNIIDRSNTH